MSHGVNRTPPLPTGAVARLVVFVVVCLLGTFALLAIYAQFRFEDGKAYTAVFNNVSGLAAGNFVRVAGVEVGKVNRISVNDDNTASVEFSANDRVILGGLGGNDGPWPRCPMMQDLRDVDRCAALDCLPR